MAGNPGHFNVTHLRTLRDLWAGLSPLGINYKRALLILLEDDIKKTNARMFTNRTRVRKKESRHETQDNPA